MKTRFFPFRTGRNLSLMLMVLFAFGSLGNIGFEVFPLGFSDPDTSLEAARALVGGDGTVILDRTHHRLLVRAGAAERDLLRQLLADLNVPPRNVTVEVDIRAASETRDRGASLGIEGEVVVVDRDASGRITLRPSVTHRTEQRRQDARQSLMVASGREASLRVGERVPWVQWINRWGVYHGLYEAEIVWQEVGAFLVVQPTVIGDGPLVRIRLIPELSGRVEGEPFRVRYTRVATDVTVSDGQTVSLGGLATSDDFYRRFLVGFDRSGTRQTLDIHLTPRLSDP